MTDTGMIMDAVASTTQNTQDTSVNNGQIETSQEVLMQALSNSPSYNMMQYMKPRQQVREYKKIGRNDPCPCGSGKKYKNCCMKSGKFEEYKNA